MNRRAAFAMVVVGLVMSASVAVGATRHIDGPAEVARIASRVEAPFGEDLPPEERVAREMADLINAERNRNGLPNMGWQPQVAAAAQAHSEDMAAHRNMVHRGSDGSDAGVRLDREGFVWRHWGENIGAGFITPAPLFEAWLNSASHRAHLLGDFLFIGVGVAATDDGVPYWTLVVADG